MSESAQKIRPTLVHTGIWVEDMDRMIEFYTGLLGLEVSDRGFVPRYNGEIAFLSSDPSVHHQVVLAAGRKPGTPSTINQLSFTVRSLDELREMHKRIVARDCPNIMPRNHGNAWSVYFDDPEGNNIEVYLDSPYHVPQPYGEPLDLSLPNEEIVSRTEKMIRGDEGFMPRATWSAERAERMG